MTTERPGPGDPDEREHERRRLERILPEIIKRIVETGYEKISEAPENVRDFVSEMKLPKEALALILAQLDDTKTGLYRVVSKEIRDFLEHTNFADELAKALTTLSFEMKTEIRFIPNDEKVGGPPKPNVKSKVRIRRDKNDKSDNDSDDDDEPDEADEPSDESS